MASDSASTAIKWGDFPLDKSLLHWHLGELKLYCQAVGNEIRVAADYQKMDDMQEPLTGEIAENLWHRWSLKKLPKEILLRPALPPLSVVVTPEQTYQVVAGISTVIYIGVPLWVQLLAGDVILFDGPVLQLSKTWFGNFLDGEMCYWVSTEANINPEPLMPDPLLCICPVDIYNKSDEQLQVEKICLRTKNLSIYHARDSLWTNHTRVRHTGQGNASDIDVITAPPKEAKQAKIISEARAGKQKSFTAKTFATLKEIPGLGIF